MDTRAQVFNTRHQVSLRQVVGAVSKPYNSLRHCERSEAIWLRFKPYGCRDCFTSFAMTAFSAMAAFCDPVPATFSTDPDAVVERKTNAAEASTWESSQYFRWYNNHLMEIGYRSANHLFVLK